MSSCLSFLNDVEPQQSAALGNRWLMLQTFYKLTLLLTEASATKWRWHSSLWQLERLIRHSWGSRASDQFCVTCQLTRQWKSICDLRVPVCQHGRSKTKRLLVGPEPSWHPTQIVIIAKFWAVRHTDSLSHENRSHGPSWGDGCRTEDFGSHQSRPSSKVCVVARDCSWRQINNTGIPFNLRPHKPNSPTSVSPRVTSEGAAPWRISSKQRRVRYGDTHTQDTRTQPLFLEILTF